jgi:acyl-coenzyme A thioesterase PaaI-like protein
MRPVQCTIEDILTGSVEMGGLESGSFAAPHLLQSWPGLVHGGALVALLDIAAGRTGRIDITAQRTLECRLTSSVPLETRLGLALEVREAIVTVSVMQRGTPLASASIAPSRAEPRPERAWAGGDDGLPMPTSDECLACGTMNPLGLRSGLRFDATGVWVRLAPPPAWVTRAGALHTAIAPVLLDEIAWWLGALTMREGGLTNRIALRVERARWPADERLVAAGCFADVAAVDRRRTFWRTQSHLRTESGDLLASATITFRGGPDFSARQFAYFRSRTPPDVFGRMFPNYA